MVVQEYHRAFSRKVGSVIGLLQSGGVSSEMFMDVVFVAELVCIGANENKRSKNVERLEEEGFT